MVFRFHGQDYLLKWLLKCGTDNCSTFLNCVFESFFYKFLVYFVQIVEKQPHSSPTKQTNINLRECVLSEFVIVSSVFYTLFCWVVVNSFLIANISTCCFKKADDFMSTCMYSNVQIRYKLFINSVYKFLKTIWASRMPHDRKLSFIKQVYLLSQKV